MLIKEGNEGNVDDGNSGYERLHPLRHWRDIKPRNAGEGAGAKQSLNNYLVSIFRLMLTVGRVSNWLTVLVSLLRLWYWA
jgi:hypothetical protein